MEAFLYLYPNKSKNWDLSLRIPGVHREVPKLAGKPGTGILSGEAKNIVLCRFQVVAVVSKILIAMLMVSSINSSILSHG